jgi:hypothetical protein
MHWLPKRRPPFMKTLLQTLGEPLLVGLFLSSLFTPATDLALLLSEKHGGGAREVLASRVVWAVASLTMSLTPAVRAISRRFGVRTVAIIGTFIDGCLLVLLPLAPSLKTVFMVHFADSINTSLVGPCRGVFLNSLSRSDSVGTFIGWTHTLQSFKRTVSLLLASLLVSAREPVEGSSEEDRRIAGHAALALTFFYASAGPIIDSFLMWLLTKPASTPKLHPSKDATAASHAPVTTPATATKTPATSTSSTMKNGIAPLSSAPLQSLSEDSVSSPRSSSSTTSSPTGVLPRSVKKAGSSSPRSPLSPTAERIRRRNEAFKTM